MKQLLSVQPFLEVVARPRPALPGRWSNLQDEAAIDLFNPNGIIPAHTPRLARNAANTIAHLLDGSAKISYFAEQADPAILVEMTGPDGQDNKYLYRLRSNQIYATTPFGQDAESLILFAIRLLIHRDTNFSRSYLRLLRGIAADDSQAELEQDMSAVVAHLLRSCEHNFDLGQSFNDTVWFYSVRLPQDDFITELWNGQGVEGLTEIFSDAGKFAQYWDGEINLPSKLRVAF